MGGKILLAVALIAAVPFVASCAGSGRGHISAQTEAGHIPVVGRGHGGKLKSAGWWAAWERVPFSSIPWGALTQLIMFLPDATNPSDCGAKARYLSSSTGVMGVAEWQVQ